MYQRKATAKFLYPTNLRVSQYGVFRSIMQSVTCAGVTGRPSVSDQRAAMAAMMASGGP